MSTISGGFFYYFFQWIFRTLSAIGNLLPLWDWVAIILTAVVIMGTFALFPWEKPEQS